MFDDQFLAMIRHIVEASRILLFRERNADGGQTIASRFRRSPLMTFLQYTNDSGIRHGVIIEAYRISKAVDEILTDERL